MKQPTLDPFSGMRPPTLPADFQQRLLSRARAAAVNQPPLVDRLWQDRRLRWAWAAMVVLLLGVHLLLVAEMTEAAGPKSGQPVAADGLAVESEWAPFLVRYSLREESSLARWRNGYRLSVSPRGGDFAS